MSNIRTKRMSFETREEKILDAARRLFSQSGFRGTTTRAIAKAAGVNEALLFRHFPTKEVLYETLLNRALEGWAQEVVPALEELRSLPVEKGLIEIGRVIIRWVKKDPSSLRTMLYASLEDHQLGKLFFKKRLPVREFLQSYFREKQRQGGIRKEDPKMLATTFLAMIFHYIHINEIYGAPNFFRQGELPTLKFFTKVFLKGVGR